jgi:TnpA family transposase
MESCRQAARVIANATFAARQAWLWGEGSTAVASDSTQFRAWDQNIFTEWHSRYRNGKRGMLIYWTVDKGGAMPCTASSWSAQHRKCTPWSRARCGTAPT